MFTDHVLVLGQVDAEDPVGRDEGLNPLDSLQLTLTLVKARCVDVDQ